MLLLTESHVVVHLVIEHPFFGTVLITRFQRNKGDLAKDIERGFIKWGHQAAAIENFREYGIQVTVVVPWNIDQDGKELVCKSKPTDE